MTFACSASCRMHRWWQHQCRHVLSCQYAPPHTHASSMRILVKKSIRRARAPCTGSPRLRELFPPAEAMTSLDAMLTRLRSFAPPAVVFELHGQRVPCESADDFSLACRFLLASRHSSLPVSQDTANVVTRARVI